MTLFEAKFLKFFLTFRNKDLENNYTNSKLPQQRAVFIIISCFALIICITSWFINPRDRNTTEVNFYAYRVALIVFIITILVIQHYKPLLMELLLFLLSIITFVALGETSKKNIESDVGRAPFISLCIYMQILSLKLIISRIGLLKNFTFNCVTNMMCSFRYIPFQENYDSKFFPLFHFVFNMVLLNLLTYAVEKKDRERFYFDKKKEFSLSCFKELIQDVLPNPIIIMQGEKVIFANQEASNSFNSKNNEGILKCFEAITVEINHDELVDSFEGSADQENDEIKIFTKTDIPLKKQEKEDLELSIYRRQSLLEFLRKSKNKFNSSNSFIKLLRGVFECSATDTTYYYDIKIKKIIWEDQYASLVTFSEDKTFVKVQQLKQQSEYKDNLLATVSHDLRTPLNGIIGMLSECIKMINDQLIKKNLNVAYRSAEYLLFMINDILDYHQISNGKLRLNFEYFSLWNLIQDVSKLIKFQAKLKGIRFIKENRVCGTNKSACIRSDPNRLKQVILNLLGNALKFTPSGSITISLEQVEQVIEGDNDFGDFLIKVTDTGVGIKREDQSKLFTLFGKLESSSKKYNKNGVGLGLVISQNLIKFLNKNRAEIKVESNFGKGSCFYFPIASILREFEENFESQTSELQINHLYLDQFNKPTSFERLANCKDLEPLLEKKEDLRILLVDDDQINIYVVSTYLKSINGVKYEIANNGLQTLEKINKNAEENQFFDILLMDCNMPIMDGFEATIKIRELIKSRTIPDVYIIACTAKASESDYEHCFKVGMNDYITKPFSKNDLRAKLKKYCERIGITLTLNFN